MKKGWNKSEKAKRSRKILALGIVLAILIIAIVYIFFIYKPECKTISCFNLYLSSPPYKNEVISLSSGRFPSTSVSRKRMGITPPVRLCIL